jgi:hypothetical protein
LRPLLQSWRRRNKKLKCFDYRRARDNAKAGGGGLVSSNSI